MIAFTLAFKPKSVRPKNLLHSRRVGGHLKCQNAPIFVLIQDVKIRSLAVADAVQFQQLRHEDPQFLRQHIGGIGLCHRPGTSSLAATQTPASLSHCARIS